ncbi:MAG: tetraacyldisaccharide 4'-kinase [Bacteroidia bacterium]|nr:tetraacyldisaccharide 4'-kinase [Bacteroidia bacterium]MDW8235003.1 tetraacyldisaccharide 4'-kinase [Bacteroidia bacterium]
MLRFLWRFLLRGLSLLIALLYGLIIRLRNWLYDKRWLRIQKVPCLVISIGNLTLGGSGKTPFALFLLSWLQQRGIRAAYLSRGYRRRSRGYQEVHLSAPDAALRYGDEAFMVKSRLPHIPVAVCRERVLGAQTLLQNHPELQAIVLDDAFQHRSIHRDVDILISDVQNALWKDWLFPFGRLREPLSSYKRAHLLIWNLKNLPKPPPLRKLRIPTLLFRYIPSRLIPAFDELPPLSLEDIQYQYAHAFCGIAYPESFLAVLRNLSVLIGQSWTFPDHHLYSPRELARIHRRFRSQQKRMEGEKLLLLTTEKDLARLRGSPHLSVLQGMPLYALAIDMVPLKPEETDARLRQLLSFAFEV